MLIERQAKNARYFSLQAANEPDLQWFQSLLGRLHS